MTAKKIKDSKSPMKNNLRGARRRLRTYPPLPVEELDLPVGALVEIADWMLDHACAATCGDREEMSIVERVRTFLHRSIEGGTAEIPTESDLMTTLALAIAAMEKRHGMAGLGETVANTLDHHTHAAPHACSQHRAPRIAPHLYCMP